MEKKSLGLGNVLQLALIALKLCGVITWNWGIVLIPTWISLVIIIMGMIATVIIKGRKK